MSQIKRKNLAFVDVETTGFDIDKHEVIQIGVVVVSQDWVGIKPNFEIIDEFEIKVKPERIEDADKESLHVNGYNETEWIFAYSQKEAIEIFAQKTADCIMVSHNICFDFGFLARAFKKTGVENKMHYHKLDTISIAFTKLHLIEDMDKYSLHFLCKQFGIDNKHSHAALSDARATYELYKKLINL